MKEIDLSEVYGLGFDLNKLVFPIQELKENLEKQQIVFLKMLNGLKKEFFHSPSYHLN